MTPLEIVVYPWIRLEHPLDVSDVTFLPRQAAVARAGQFGPYVEAATSYFFELHRVGDPDGREPGELVPVDPSVVLLDGEVTTADVERANLVLFFSTLFHGGKSRTAKATNFYHFQQGFGDKPTRYSRRSRRMFGSSMLGGSTANVIETRPPWCGEFQLPDAEMYAAMQVVAHWQGTDHLWRALDALLLATSDADTIPPRAEHANYARAFKRLLHRAGQKRRTRMDEQAVVAESLLRPLLHRFPTRAGVGYILDVRRAAAERRNDFWHPEAAKPSSRPFENQTVVHPNLIAFRAFAALFVASLREVSGASLSRHLESFVAAVEHWIGGIDRDDARDPDSASAMGKLWARLEHVSTTAWDEDPRSA